jgi:hypothetical protein
VLCERLPQVLSSLVARLYQVITVNGRRHGNPLAATLHELEHAGLGQHVLKNDAVGPQQQVALARNEILVLRVVEVPEQCLLGEGQRPAQPVANDFEPALRCLIDARASAAVDSTLIIFGHASVRKPRWGAKFAPAPWQSHNAFIGLIDAFRSSLGNGS